MYQLCECDAFDQCIHSNNSSSTPIGKTLNVDEELLMNRIGKFNNTNQFLKAKTHRDSAGFQRFRSHPTSNIDRVHH